MILSNRSKRAMWYMVSGEVRHVEKLMGREMTKEEVISFLFGDSENYPETELRIMVIDEPDQKLHHRLNMLWAFPLSLAVAPLSYIFTGGIGWTDKTAFGRFILRCVGVMK